MTEAFGTDTTDSRDTRKEFLVVGLGGSAGAIPAFREFFRNVSAESGMAYVVILHLSPEYDSKLAEVLQSASSIPVTQVREKVRIARDHVYVIPPNHSLAIVDGHLSVSPMTGFEERRAPVDIFFRTLGETHGSSAVCVIVSGSGADGSMGLRRVKEHNGLVLAQEPSEAQFDEMPRHSIATGLVDVVLPVAEMPERIVAYRDQIREAPLTRVVDEYDEQVLIDLLTTLRVRTGHDFSNYKRATLVRRIARRMALHGLTSLSEYAQSMRERPDEPDLLLREFLISVTNFFRDPLAWDIIQERVVPKLFEGKGIEDHVRVWVPGCATGEEAYTVAMLLTEAASRLSTPPEIQIFATDLDEDAIAKARNGSFNEADVADVSPERLRRHFLKEQDHYRVRRELRELILFAHHNVLKDPPFSHLDFISCRNLLIYLNAAAQDRTMEVLHFALEPGGFLLLGTAESADGSSHLFSTASKEAHLYQSRAVPRIINISPAPRQLTIASDLRSTPSPANRRDGGAIRLTSLDLHHRLIEEYAPPSLIVDEDHEIVHLSDGAGRYLQFLAGEASLNVLQVVRPELRIGLRTALFQAAQKQAQVILRGIDIQNGERPEGINLIVRPTPRAEGARGYFLILFEENHEAVASEIVFPPSGEPAARQLEAELIRVKAQMRATTEQYEVQAEEARASNEELQAINEELRSTAEELETSQEELQSLNEELRTVNQELKVKIEEIGHANDDLRNLMSSTEIGTIFVDRALGVKLFTPRVRDLFNLIPADVGRPLLDINNKLLTSDFGRDLELVLDRLQTIEREVQSRDGRWFLMRLLPYRTAEDRIDGVVVTFLDVTERHRAQEVLRETQVRQAYLLKLSDALRDLTDPLEIQATASRVLGEQLGTGRAYFIEIDQRAGDFVVTRDWHVPSESTHSRRYALNEWPMEWLVDGRTWSSRDIDNDPALPEDQRERYRSNGIGAAIVVPHAKSGKLLGAFVTSQRIPRNWIEHDISLVEETAQRAWGAVERARAEDALRASERRLQRMVNVPGLGVLTFDVDGTLIRANDAFLDMVGYSREELQQRSVSWRDFTPDEHILASLRILDQVRTTGRGGPYEKEYFRKDGSRVWLMFVAADLGDGTIVEYALDITVRKAAEAALRESETMLATELQDAKALQRISSQIIHEQNIDVLYEQILEAAMSILRSDMGSLQTLDPDGETLRLIAWRGLHPESAAYWSEVTSSSESSCGHAFANAQRDILPDVSVADIPKADASFREYQRSGIAAIQSTPLLSRDGRTVGMISTHWRKPHIPGDREMRLFDVLARQAADVLEARRIDEALRRSEQRYRTLFESIDEGFCIIDVLFDENDHPHDYRFVDVNPAFEKQTGLSGAVGKTVRDMVPGHDQHWFDIYGGIAQSETPARFENVATALGRCYEVFAFPFGDTKNRVAVLFNDITERKRSHDALRDSQQRLETLTNLVPDLLWSIDASGKVDWCNQRWLEYTGQSSEAACSDGWLDAIHPSERRDWIRELEDAFRLRERLRVEHRIRNEAGEFRWFLIQAEPLHSDSRIVRWLGAATDIHDQRILRDELEERVLVRTRELAAVSTQRQHLLERLVNATELERQRIARELHDEMGQHLSALRIGLERIEKDDPSIESLKQMVNRLDYSVDRLTFELRPPALDQLGLDGAVSSLASEFSEVTGIAVDVHLAGVDRERFPAAIETAMYRVVQEALLNIRKHARRRRRASSWTEAARDFA